MSRFHQFDIPDLPILAFQRRGRGIATLEGGGKGGGGTPPPDPRLVEAQITSLGIQNDAINKMMAMSQETLPLQKQQMQASLDATNEALKQSQDNYSYTVSQRNKLTPLQDQVIADAKNYNVGDESARLIKQSGADVEQAFDSQAQQNARAMARMGVNPSSGAWASTQNANAISAATAKAQGAASARQTAKTQGYALTDRAVNTMAGYPSMTMQSIGQTAGLAGQGLNVVNQGVAGMLQAPNAAARNAASMGGNASSMYGTQANAYAKSQSQDNGIFGALGSVAGAALASPWVGGLVLSDENAKTDKKVVDDDEALAAVRKIPVSSWRYKTGVGDEGAHIGPMAQDVQAAAGDQSAPGGKAIDMISANGINLAAIRALDKKVRKLEQSARSNA